MLTDRRSRGPNWTIDYFENRDDRATSEDVLDSDDGISWYLNSVQYEQDTGYIHLSGYGRVDGSGQVW